MQTRYAIVAIVSCILLQIAHGQEGTVPRSFGAHGPCLWPQTSASHLFTYMHAHSRDIRCSSVLPASIVLLGEIFAKPNDTYDLLRISEPIHIHRALLPAGYELAAPEAAPFASPEAAPFAAPEAAPFAAPEAAPFAAPFAEFGAASYAAPDASPEAAPAAAPDASPVAAPEENHVFDYTTYFSSIAPAPGPAPSP